MNLIKTTVKNFVRHGDTDLAAGLTYYAVFAIFPALLALASLLSVVGDSDTVVKTIQDVLRPLVSHRTLHDITPTLRTLTRVHGAPVTLTIGALAALWSASGYVGAFSRAMNAVREVEETRPFWKLRPLMLLVTLIAVVLNAVALVIVVVSGPVSDSVATKIGVGDHARQIYEIGKWPVLALVVVIVVGLLYRVTPNQKRGFRLITPGAFLALVLAVVASAGFAYYVTNFSSYNKTYGSIAGVIIGLLWLWLTNVALLLGAEVDAVRDTRRAQKKAQKQAQKQAQKADQKHEAHAAMVAVSGPVDTAAAAEAVAAQADLERLMPPAAVSSSRRRDKARVTESFPQKAGEPPYGPALQPVPDED